MRSFRLRSSFFIQTPRRIHRGLRPWRHQLGKKTVNTLRRLHILSVSNDPKTASATAKAAAATSTKGRWTAESIITGSHKKQKQKHKTKPRLSRRKWQTDPPSTRALASEPPSGYSTRRVSRHEAMPTAYLLYVANILFRCPLPRTTSDKMLSRSDNILPKPSPVSR